MYQPRGMYRAPATATPMYGQPQQQQMAAGQNRYGGPAGSYHNGQPRGYGAHMAGPQNTAGVVAANQVHFGTNFPQAQVCVCVTSARVGWRS